MNLENRIKKIEEKIGRKEEETLLIINRLPSGEEEGLEELPESVEEWLTFKEQMENPKVRPINNMRVFVKDYLRELEARRKLGEVF